MKHEDFIELSNLINHAFALVAAPIVYEQWNDKFAREEAKTPFLKLQARIKKDYDLRELTTEQASMLHFGKWDELRLVPLHLVDAFRDGTELICINGGVSIVGKDTIDKDIRFGCLAYGLRLQ